jgi:[ribosomal protein S18]-alanine N-acetyltransferase
MRTFQMKTLTTSSGAQLILRPIVLGSPKDLDEVVRIERESYPDAFDADTFLEFLSEGSQCLIAETEQGIVAFMLYVEKKTKFHIEDIAVQVASRRGGIARTLIASLMERMVSEGKRHISLEVRKSNQVARDCYVRLGFLETKIKVGYYWEDGEDAVVMQYRRPSRSSRNTFK